MITTRNLTHLTAILSIMAGASMLASCSSSSSDKASTSQKPAATAPAPSKPAPQPLPPGLATGSLDDIDTARQDNEVDRLYRRNRPVGTPLPLKVAILLPQSGQAGAAGEIILKAAQMAVFDSGQDRMTLMPYDTESTPAGARAAAMAAEQDGAQLVLGPLFGAHVQPVAQIMSARSVPVLAFSNDHSAAGNGAAVLGLTPENEVRRILGHASMQGLQRIAAFLPDSPFGLLVADKLRELAPLSGLEAVRITHYPAGAFADNQVLLDTARRFADYDARRAALQREKANATGSALARLENLDTFGDPPFDAVLLAEPQDRLSTVAPLLAYYDVDPKRIQFLGLSRWYGEGLEREPTLINAVFPGPSPDEFEQLMTRYVDRYGVYPGRLAALAYDAVAVAADLAGRVGSDGRITSDMILQPDGYAAYFGAFRIQRDGTAERLLAIMRVTESGLVVADPAPLRFQPLLN
ncbi:MAG: penicillin-binding protein activator [Minwuia sp.]|uniref:penicillin-binding protein activator n=1 Tax=Minwuia sp. TaxID=2493630 RepID=UPI003A8668E9